MNTSQNNKTIKINMVDLIGPNVIRLSTYLQIKDILNLDTSSKTLKDDYEVHVWKFQWKTKLQQKENRNNYRQAVIQYRKNEIKKKKNEKFKKKAETFLKVDNKRRQAWKSFASVRSRSNIWDRWEKMFENEKSKARLHEYIKKNLPLFFMEDLNVDRLDVKDLIRLNMFHNGTIPRFMWEEMTIVVDEWYIEDLMSQIENTKDIRKKRKLLHNVEITEANLEHFYKKHDETMDVYGFSN